MIIDNAHVPGICLLAVFTFFCFSYNKLSIELMQYILWLTTHKVTSNQDQKFPTENVQRGNSQNLVELSLDLTTIIMNVQLV